MASLPWFRLYTETRVDKKLATLPDDEHRCWLHLLCYSAEKEPRGVIDISDPLIVALECAKGDEELLTRTVERLERLKVLGREEGFIFFEKFHDRQYPRASERPEEVRERVRKYRAKGASGD